MSGSIPQNGPGNALSVSRAKDAVLIQILGLGNMFLAPTLQSFVESELKMGLRNFIIDMQKCEGMDSTFMGTFIGLSMKVKSAEGWFCLVNISEANMRLLKMLGVLHMVSIHEGEFPEPTGKATLLYPTRDPQVRQNQIYTAHRLLIDADPENEKIFGPFVKALEAELFGAGADLKNLDKPSSAGQTPAATEPQDDEDAGDVPTILPPSDDEN